MTVRHHSVVIVGGGAAGISVAANLERTSPGQDVALIEPCEDHFYQPAFTLVGAGVTTLATTRRFEVDLLPRHTTWIRDRVAGFEPEANQVVLGNGERVSYDFLIVCPGLQLDWGKVEGLTATIGKHGVCSNYSPNYAPYTWECVQNTRHGRALFTQSPMPIKCPGAPQKAAYLAADRWRRAGIAGDVEVCFLTAAPAIFGVPLFAKELLKVVERYGIKLHTQTNLVAIDGPEKTATFERALPDGAKERFSLSFEMCHVTPPMGPPDCVRHSPLANAAGYVEVSDSTLQHVRYPNVFGLGDACSTGNSKTAAAVRKQMPVVVDNLLAVAAGQPLPGVYDGYASCPLTTSLDAVILAEFCYGGKVTPSFPMDPRPERWIWWIGKKYGLPLLYWNYMLKGIDFDIPHKASYMDSYPDAAG
jgi:sulfide:quinone oxidoreductase